MSCSAYRDRPEARGRAVRVLRERGRFLHQRPGAPPRRRHRRGILDRSTGPGSILTRPPLSAVMLGLPPFLFVPEAAHAGNTDGSPFRAHRSSPVVDKCPVGKRCARPLGSDGWYSSNADECLLRKRSFLSPGAGEFPRFGPSFLHPHASCCPFRNRIQTWPSFPPVPGAAPLLGGPPPPRPGGPAQPPRATPAARLPWTVGLLPVSLAK